MRKARSIYRGVRWPAEVIAAVEACVAAGAPSFSAVVIRTVLRAIRRGELKTTVKQPSNEQ